ncbi:MAG: 50S ribosomal protein L4 [Chloroflexi bacterium]|nr:50S ribosomal protein L4 [Chloroflexota bacterium]
MKFPLYTSSGKSTKQIELADNIFAAPVNPVILHQAYLRERANARLGTHKAKTRGEVSGSTAKVWRQKGTGRARQGSRKAPQWSGGGVVFGPTPERNYKRDMPQKMRRLALRGALTSKAGEGKIIVVNEFQLKESKTKEMAGLLEKLKVETSALILLPSPTDEVERAARNLPSVKTLLAQYLNVEDLLTYDWLILPQASLPIIEKILGDKKNG